RFGDVGDLVRRALGAPPTVGEAEDRVRAPAAAIGTAAGGDQVDAPRAVVLPPDVDVAGGVDRRPVGPGESVEVGDLLALRVGDDRLPLVHDDDVRPPGQVLGGVVGRLRAAQDHGPAVRLGGG